MKFLSTPSVNYPQNAANSGMGSGAGMNTPYYSNYISSMP